MASRFTVSFSQASVHGVLRLDRPDPLETPMRCPRCQQENLPQARFCHQCRHQSRLLTRQSRNRRAGRGSSSL